MSTATLEPNPVANRKPSKKPPEPEPKEVVLKLPPEYGPILDAMKAKKGRAKTVSMQVALERLARDEGIPFTPNWPEFLGDADSRD